MDEMRMDSPAIPEEIESPTDERTEELAEDQAFADDFPQPTDEDLRRWEREREERWEAYLAPFKAAAAQRKESARLSAEHDNDLAEILFEITMMQLEV